MEAMETAAPARNRRRGMDDMPKPCRGPIPAANHDSPAQIPESPLALTRIPRLSLPGQFRMKNVVLLGSTGSIGTSTLKVVEDLPDQLRLIGLAAGGNADLLTEQARRHRPAIVSIQDPTKVAALQSALPDTRVVTGEAGLLELATLPDADVVLIAIVGTAGLAPALAAIRAGKHIAVASKEILVMAGAIVMSEARRHGVQVLAVDSEHSAIFQCLDGKPAASVRALWLTASGGPFRDRTRWSPGAFQR